MIDWLITHHPDPNNTTGYMQASIASRGVNMPCPMLGQNGCAYSYTYVG